MSIQEKIMPWVLSPDNNGDEFVTLASKETKKFDEVTFGDAVKHCTQSVLSSHQPGLYCRKGRSCPLYMSRYPTPICNEMIYLLKDNARKQGIITDTDQINLRNHFEEIRQQQCLDNPNISWCGCYGRELDKSNYTNIIDALSSGGFNVGNPQCWYKPCKQMDPNQLHMIPSEMTDYFSFGLGLGPDTSESVTTYEVNANNDGSTTRIERSCPQAMCQNINIVSDSLILGDVDLDQKIDCNFTQLVVDPLSGSTETEYKNPETTTKPETTTALKDPNENISVVRNDDTIEITRPTTTDNNNNGGNDIDKEQLEEQRRLMMVILGSLFFVFVLLVYLILSQ